MTDAFGRIFTNNPNSFNLSYSNANAKSSNNNANANEIVTYFYTSSNNIISPHALGQIRYNNIDQTKATQIHISYTTKDAIDVKESLLKLSPQTKIYIQDKLYSTSYIEYIAGTIIDNGAFITIGVSVLRSSFADVNNFANLLEVILKTTITR
jgi:hypothetical protein